MQSLRGSSSRNPPAYAATTPSRRVRDNDTCYNCQEKGHWMRDCPNSSKKPDPPTPPSAAAGSTTPGKERDRPDPPEPFVGADGLLYVKCVPCPCGAGNCPLVTHNGKQFYVCPSYNKQMNDTRCGFKKSLEEVMKQDDYVDVPICACGAKPCRMLPLEKDGPNAGLRHFVCPIKKGQGACPYSVWKNTHGMTISINLVDNIVSSPESTLGNCDDGSPSNGRLVEEYDLWLDELTGANKSHGFPILGPMPGSLKRDKLRLEEKGGEDSLGEPSRKNYKRLRHGDPKIDDSAIGTSVRFLDKLQMNSMNCLIEEEVQVPFRAFQAGIRHRQTEFWRQISVGTRSAAPLNTSSFTVSASIHEDWMTSALRLNLGDQLQGWWGRLVFPPSHCLIIPSPKPFFCCVFPSFDAICVPKDENVLDVGDSAFSLRDQMVTLKDTRSLLTLNGDTSMPGLIPKGSRSLILSHESGQSNIMNGSILEGFGLVAKQFQKKLVTLLESTNVHNHESMLREAHVVFYALDRLLFDRDDFTDRVMDFIRCAASLAKLEQSTSGVCCRAKVLFDRYIYEKKKVDKVSEDHMKAVDDLKISKKQLDLLLQERSRLQERLYQLEAEISWYKAESYDLEASVEEILKKKAEVEKSYEIASKEMEAAQEYAKRKKADRDTAEAAFKRASVLLQQSIV